MRIPLVKRSLTGDPSLFVKSMLQHIPETISSRSIITLSEALVLKATSKTGYREI